MRVRKGFLEEFSVRRKNFERRVPAWSWNCHDLSFSVAININDGSTYTSAECLFVCQKGAELLSVCVKDVHVWFYARACTNEKFGLRVPIKVACRERSSPFCGRGECVERCFARKPLSPQVDIPWARLFGLNGASDGAAKTGDAKPRTETPVTSAAIFRTEFIGIG
jgi:hypothetical protein